MGFYTHLHVDERCVFAAKNQYPPGLDVLFDPEDSRRVEADEDDVETDVIEADRALVCFRLNVNGYSLKAAEHAYDSWPEFINRPSEVPEYFDPSILSESFFRSRSFERYLEDVLKTMNGELEDQIPLAGNYLLHFPHEDPLVVTSALIHTVHGSSVRATIDIQDSPVSLTSDRRKVLVLTEGKTDARFLQRGLRAVAPEYARELQFLDYSYKPRGGASEIAHLLKAFAAAGVNGPVLALLDNDTAGHQELQVIRALRLSENLQSITYPDIDLARSYPTLGPNGPQSMDVNRAACSIEMYFGDQVLTLDAGLSPVRWTGFNDSLQRYQGEVSNKKEIQQRIEARLTDLESGQAPDPPTDLIAILASIVEAAAHFRLGHD